MAITDEQIDLTVEHKFSSGDVHTWVRTPESRAYDKLFRRYVRSDMFFKYCKPSSELPWNVKRLNDSDLNKTRKRRSYDDWLSDDFGVTVRITEDNTLLYFGDRIVNPLVIEEYFMETLGYLPYESIAFCMECHNKYIHSLKNRNSWGTCEFHRTPKTPWIYTQRWRINNGTGI